jgi:Uma2 family endonuclease
MSTPARARQRLITAKEFAELPNDITRRCELVRGVVCEMSPPNWNHGAVAARVASLLQLWSDRAGAGTVRVESGFVLARSPDTVRGPDVSFVRRGRAWVTDGPWIRGGPDLAVEVRSPHDRQRETDERVADYFAAGTTLVWIVDPAARTIVVRSPGAPDRTLTESDFLEGGDVLPGFRVAVREVFVDLEQGTPGV